MKKALSLKGDSSYLSEEAYPQPKMSKDIGSKAVCISMEFCRSLLQVLSRCMDQANPLRFVIDANQAAAYRFEELYRRTSCHV